MIVFLNGNYWLRLEGFRLHQRSFIRAGDVGCSLCACTGQKTLYSTDTRAEALIL